MRLGYRCLPEDTGRQIAELDVLNSIAPFRLLADRMDSAFHRDDFRFFPSRLLLPFSTRRPAQLAPLALRHQLSVYMRAGIEPPRAISAPPHGSRRTPKSPHSLSSTGSTSALRVSPFSQVRISILLYD